MKAELTKMPNRNTFRLVWEGGKSGDVKANITSDQKGHQRPSGPTQLMEFLLQHRHPVAVPPASTCRLPGRLGTCTLFPGSPFCSGMALYWFSFSQASICLCSFHPSCSNASGRYGLGRRVFMSQCEPGGMVVPGRY